MKWIKKKNEQNAVVATLYIIEQNHKMENKKVYVLVTSAALTYYNFKIHTQNSVSFSSYFSLSLEGLVSEL